MSIREEIAESNFACCGVGVFIIPSILGVWLTGDLLWLIPSLAITITLLAVFAVVVIVEWQLKDQYYGPR